MTPTDEMLLESDVLSAVDARRLNKSDTLGEQACNKSVPERRSPPCSTGQASFRVTALDRWLVQRLLSLISGLPLEIALWNGQVFAASSGSIESRMTIHSRSALWSLCLDPCLGFGDGYMQGEITVTGDLARFCELANHAARQAPRWFDNRMWRWLHWLTPNTRSAAKNHIQHHYDLGNDFYKLWLDDEMAYTCAYFADPTMDLAAAQKAKFNHIARKLRLKPGMRVVEAGSGWGGLAMHLVRKYGVTVQAYNISREQVAYSRQRAHQAGLDGQVTYIEDDWRTIGGQFDAFVSVGMLEHVGPENFREFGNAIHRCLKPEGLALLHTIGRNYAKPVDRWTEKRIFPGGCPPSMKEMMDIFETHDFSVLDVENLRLHYARTLEFWRDNFESHADEVGQMYDEQFVRKWRLYLNASIATFRTGNMQLFQTVIAHGRNNSVPWTRADLYTDTEVHHA